MKCPHNQKYYLKEEECNLEDCLENGCLMRRGPAPNRAVKDLAQSVRLRAALTLRENASQKKDKK